MNLQNQLNQSPEEEQPKRVPPTPPPIPPRSPESAGGKREPEMPPAPAPGGDFRIRAMEGDIKGEAAVEPTEALAPSPAEVLPPEEEAPELKPETTVAAPGGPVMPEIEEEAKKPKTWFWIVMAVIIIAGLGALGYFVVYPLLFPPEAPSPTEVEPGGPAPIEPTIETHQSFFATPAAAVAQVSFPDLNLLNIAVELQSESLDLLPGGAIKEIEILDEAGNQVPFASYLSQFLPKLGKSKLADWFENDFTAYFYYDDNGVWPGYVARIQSGAKTQLPANLNQHLESADITAFYITPAGVMGAFKDGQVNSYVNRYSVGSRTGTAFNYGYFGDYLVISTSYSGLKAALPLLGL